MMADKKISALTASTTPLSGSEVLPIVQGGTTVKVAVTNLTEGRNVGSLSNTIGGGGADGSVYLKRTDGVTVNTESVNSTDGAIDYTTAYGRQRFYNYTGLVLDIGGADVAQSVVIASGNLVFGTAGKGIDFSADPSAPGMTSELLDDYEEGTWTPTIAFDGASVGVTYFAQTGTYTKIGNAVTVTGNLYIDSNGSSTGSLEIRGFPFSANSYSSISLSIRGGMTYTGTVLAYINVAEARASVEQTSEAGVMTPITQANIFTPQIFFTCTYTTNS